jgi:hypothetical protein
MSKNKKGRQPVDDNQDDAAKIARGTQQPGQTREQTRIIAKGIRKGIEQYKKQHKAKLRDLDRSRKKAAREINKGQESGVDTDASESGDSFWKSGIPWLLLAVTWIGIAVCVLSTG